jgi:2-(1,2-epoxy-1,2-dihydrophenyl)acetyl-CoA isomerase
MAEVNFAEHDGIGVLTLDDPPTRNAIGRELSRAIGEVVCRVRVDRTVRALVLTGAGGHFCAGGNVRAMGAGRADPAEVRTRMLSSQQWLRDLITLDRPVIAAVDGVAFGAGLSLALCADLVLASTRARFCAAFVRIGLVPDYGLSYTLPRVVGVQRAKELAMTGREVGADEALRLGLAMEVQPPEMLLPRAMEMAASLTRASPDALSMIKRGFAAAVDLGTCFELEAHGQALTGATAWHCEAVADFLARRPPRFRWPVER